MAKLRKMLGSADASYIVSLMRLIETQSKETIADWCVNYAEKNILGIYEKDFPDDIRLRELIHCFRAYRAGTIKVKDLKTAVAAANAAAREAEGNPAAQAAARTAGQAAAAVYTPTHSLGFAFYGSAAIAYDRVGIYEKPEVYEQIASEECCKMESALWEIAVLQEKNPAKLKWHC